MKMRCKPPMSVALPCPACGAEAAGFRINLISLDDENAFSCEECDAEFSFTHLQKCVNAWGVLLPAVAAMADVVNSSMEDAESEAA